MLGADARFARRKNLRLSAGKFPERLGVLVVNLDDVFCAEIAMLRRGPHLRSSVQSFASISFCHANFSYERLVSS